MKEKTLTALLASPHLQYYTFFGYRFQRPMFRLAVFYSIFTAVNSVWINPKWLLLYVPVAIGLYWWAWRLRRTLETTNPNLIPKDPT